MVFILSAAVMALEVIFWLIIADVVLSYFPGTSRNPLVLTLRKLTGPLLAPFRKLIRPQRFGEAYVDFSPLIALLLVRILSGLLAGIAAVAPH